MEQQQQLFDELLKKSIHFADTANTTREAAAQIIGELIAAIIDSGSLTDVKVAAILRRLEHGTGHPSLDTSRRIMIDRIRRTGQK